MLYGHAKAKGYIEKYVCGVIYKRESGRAGIWKGCLSKNVKETHIDT